MAIDPSCDSCQRTKLSQSFNPCNPCSCDCHKKSFYFTFGQAHVHRVNGVTFDADCVAEIKATGSTEAREKAFEAFGAKWAFQYDDLEKVGMHYYSRGVIALN